MELDKERSGHCKENILSLVFFNSDCDIALELTSDKAKELKEFLDEVLD